MPELPEVETLCRQLQTKICGRKILTAEIYDDKLAALNNVRGQKVTAVERESKRIVMSWITAMPYIFICA
jgi:formamidopyrimidine-DNA glycosylase